MNHSSRVLLVGTCAAVAAFSGAIFRQGYDRRVDRVGSVATQARGLSVQGLVASLDDSSSIPLDVYYQDMVKLVKQQYVDSVTDDQKLASGAVRGMIVSLGDPKSLYMDKDEFRMFLNSREGKYEGIGAELHLEVNGPKRAEPATPVPPSEDAEDFAFRSTGIPKLVVSFVVPGGPADKAGVKAGDLITNVDAHYVVEESLIRRVLAARSDFIAKKVTYDAVNAVQKEYREKMERALLPLRAKDKLMLGKTGQVQVTLKRGTELISVKIQKAEIAMPKLAASGDSLVLPLNNASVENLKKVLSGRTSLTIDLRNNVSGDFDSMRKCLPLLTTPGRYGAIFNDRKENPVPLIVSGGRSVPLKLKLLVDASTRGAAEILALALSSQGKAELVGRDMGGDRAVREIVQLPDGSGYTLVTGVYKPDLPKKSPPTKVAAKASAQGVK